MGRIIMAFLIGWGCAWGLAHAWQPESPSQALERMQQRQERVEQESFRSQQWLEQEGRRNNPC